MHTTTQYTPDQLVFGHYSILNQHHDVDWEAIKKRKQDLINKGNAHDNTKHKTTHTKQGKKFYSECVKN